jgi:predicted nucleotidyltransferase
MEKNTREKLEIMIEVIKNQIDPQKIILFGSFARGTQKEDSDLDICVITDHNKRKIDMLREIRLSIIEVKTNGI